MKDLIKQLSAEQRDLKNQRKTVNRIGPKTMEPYMAIRKHGDNRYLLRHLFVAYALERGKEPVLPTKSEFNMSYVEKLREKYALRSDRSVA